MNSRRRILGMVSVLALAGSLVFSDVTISPDGKNIFLVADARRVFAAWESGGSVVFDRSLNYKFQTMVPSLRVVRTFLVCPLNWTPLACLP